MRKLVFIIVVMLLLPCITLAESPSTDTLTNYAEVIPQRTTEKEILFQGMLWGSSDKEAEQIVKDAFPEIDDVHRQTSWINDSVWNFYDSGNVLPRYSSPHVDTLKIEFQRKSPWSGIYMPFGKVAGYNIDKIWLNFIKYSSFRYSLYEAVYQFDTLVSNSTIPIKDQYLDLKDKLTKLYGESYLSTVDGEKLEENSALWIGDNGSAVNLTYSKYTGGYLDGDEFIYLKYGTTTVNKYFIQAEQAADEAAQRKIEEERERVKDDNSGL